ncbi:MAG: hypothetical protein SFU99_05315, partial [Saprospiraceae bacterium]|nr:hypothetical protein [Saprospiraceae bacterium]
MKNTFLLLLLCGLGLGVSHAQDAVPFTFKTRKGVVIKQEVLDILLGTTWTSYKQYAVKAGKAQPQKSNFFALRINADSAFQVSGTNYRQNGQWAVKGKSLQLQVVEDVKAPNPESFSIKGDYLIYKITNDELLLVKELQGGEQWVGYFKGTKPAGIGPMPMAS